MSEERIDIEQIKEEWLVGNAVVAFVGALLMAQAWEPTDARNAIPILNVTVPIYPQAVVLSIVAFLAGSSFVLALASAIPPLRTWAIQRASPHSHLLEILMWVAFVLSLIAALNEIPRDQWWAEALWWGGAILLFFLWGRLMLRPLLPPAKWLTRLLIRFVGSIWTRLMAWRQQPTDDGSTDGH